MIARYRGRYKWRLTKSAMNNSRIVILGQDHRGTMGKEGETRGAISGEFLIGRDQQAASTTQGERVTGTATAEVGSGGIDTYLAGACRDKVKRHIGQTAIAEGVQKSPGKVGQSSP